MSDHKHAGNGSPQSGDEQRDDHHAELAHVTPVRLLLTIWGALMVRRRRNSLKRMSLNAASKDAETTKPHKRTCAALDKRVALLSAC